MNCPKCNFVSHESSKFCGNCGNSLTETNNGVKIGETVEKTSKATKKGGCLKPILITLGSIVAVFILIVIIAVNSDSTSTSSTSSNTQEPLDAEKFKAESTKIPYKELSRNPKDYTDNKVVFTGKVIQVLESGNNASYRINVTKGEYGYDDTVYVAYKRGKDESRILEDDIVQFWGISNGLKTYKSTLGGEITIPQVNALIIKLVK